MPAAGGTETESKSPLSTPRVAGRADRPRAPRPGPLRVRRRLSLRTRARRSGRSGPAQWGLLCHRTLACCTAVAPARPSRRGGRGPAESPPRLAEAPPGSPESAGCHCRVATEYGERASEERGVGQTRTELPAGVRSWPFFFLQNAFECANRPMLWLWRYRMLYAWLNHPTFDIHCSRRLDRLCQHPWNHNDLLDGNQESLQNSSD